MRTTLLTDISCYLPIPHVISYRRVIVPRLEYCEVRLKITSFQITLLATEQAAVLAVEKQLCAGKSLPGEPLDNVQIEGNAEARPVGHGEHALIIEFPFVLH